jgi:dihydrofolate reductase
MSSGEERKLIASVNVSLDGFSAGPDGEADVMWFVEHVTDQFSSYFEGVYRASTTALLGRRNYEGFYAVWPAITEAPETSARDRDLGTWMNEVEKVVFSRTLEKANWQNTRIAERELEDEVRELKRSEGRDIVILNSASIIRQLLAADLVDELRMNLIPAMVGGGLRLFGDGLPRSSWELAAATRLATGVLVLEYTRPA